jgi:hypothetical protein
MRLVKQFGLKAVRSGLLVCGGLVILSALGGSALARTSDAPEIDPNSLSSALTLLAGGVMLLAGRRRRK